MLSWGSRSSSKQDLWLWIPAFAGTTCGEIALAGAAKEKSLFLLRLFRHPLEAFLHFLHLAAQVVDVVFLGRRLGCFLRLGSGRGSAARRYERLEHREGLLEQFHVAANVLFQRRERRA